MGQTKHPKPSGCFGGSPFKKREATGRCETFCLSVCMSRTICVCTGEKWFRTFVRGTVRTEQTIFFVKNQTPVATFIQDFGYKMSENRDTRRVCGQATPTHFVCCRVRVAPKRYYFASQRDPVMRRRRAVRVARRHSLLAAPVALDSRWYAE